MKRLAVVAMATMALLCAPSLWAQHGGHGGGGRRGAPGAAGGRTADTSLTDFNHALAVQATSEQASRFQELTKQTATAIERLENLLQASGKTDRVTELSQKTVALKGAVEDAQGSAEDFLKSLSKPQKAGLKELTKKLEKADSEVAKQWKDLEKQLADGKADVEVMAGTADRLKKALADFQSQQSGLGSEMGIEPAEASGG